MLRLCCRSRPPADRQRTAGGLRRFADDNSATATGLCRQICRPNATLVQTAANLLNTCAAQVITGAHSFTYDHVFGADSTPPDQLYGHCVEPLVSGLFKGYNATGVGVSWCMYCAQCSCSKQVDFCDIMGGTSYIRTGISTCQEPPLHEGGMLVCSVCIRSDWIRQDLYYGKCFHSWW